MIKHAAVSAAISIGLLTSVSAPVYSADASPTSSSTVVWKPFASFDAFEQKLRLANALIDRGLAELAVEELADISEEEALNATRTNRALYGLVSIRAALETSRLTTSEGRADAAERIASVWERFGGEIDAETSGFALAFVRGFSALVLLASESGNDEECARYLDATTSLARAAVGALSKEDAKPFLYWHAKATLSRRGDPDRFKQAERVASALEKSSSATRDEYYFYARLLLVESAREQGAFEQASRRISETLDALAAAARKEDAPVEAAVGLVAEEVKTLTAEGKLDEAVVIAAQNVDLLDAPLPTDRGRYVDKLPDLFAELELTRVETFWKAAEKAPEGKEKDPPTNRFDKRALVDAARLAASTARTNVQRSRATLRANASGQVSGDWLAIQASAEESYRTGAWDDAIAGYDLASREASASGAEADSFRLRGTAAGVVDKVCRENLFEQTTNKDSVAWEQDARRRFEELALENPNDERAPSFYLLALEHASRAGEDESALNKLRLDYLKLFPNAPNRGVYALDLARRLLADANRDGVEAALDAIAADDSVLSDALELERSLYKSRRAQAPERSPFIPTAARLLRKTSGLDTTEIASLKELSDAIIERARTMSKSDFTEADSSILALIVELALDDDARQDAGFAAALDELLDAWEERSTDASTIAKIRSYRLSLAVDTKSPQEIVEIFNSVDGASSSSLDALDRLVSFAEQAQDETRKRLARFSLDSIDKLAVDKADADRVVLVKADASRLSGESQEALRLYAGLLKKDRKNARVLKGLATLLSTQTDDKALALALKYWSDYADLQPDASPDWWNAKERCVEIYCKSGKKDQAEKMLKTLWLTRTDPSDPNRKDRWEKTIKTARPESGAR